MPDPLAKYVGCVLASREENYYDDSDFYSVVYDVEEDRVIRVATGSTRYAGGGVLPVDATDEIKAKALLALARMLARHKELTESFRTEGIMADDGYSSGPEVEIGDTVRSLTKRGKNVGAEGVVTAKDRMSFGVTYSDWAKTNRVAFLVEGESRPRWMDEDRVEVVAKGTPKMTDCEIREWAIRYATSLATNNSWHTPFTKDYLLRM